jgi:hypothetical protein
MCRADFPQEGSHPWVAMDLITRLSKHVVDIKMVEDDGKPWAGLGFLRKEGRKTALFSINHVIDGYKKISFLNEHIMNPKPMNIGDEDDPVCRLSVPSNVPGADIPTLDMSEVDMVDSLFFIKRDENTHETKLSYVSKFKFENNGNIKASIDLSRGNSGGPAFAVMKDETVKYAGATSGGDHDNLTGNFISSVCSMEPRNGRLDTDSESGQSTARNTKKRVSFRLNDSDCIADIRARCTILNRQIQSFYDKLVGVWFIDEGDDGNEMRYFESNADVIRFMNEREDEHKDVKDPSDNRKKKRKDWWKTNRVTILRDVKHQLRAIYRQADQLLNEQLRDRLMKDVRYGKSVRVRLDDHTIEYTPVVGHDSSVAPFTYIT